MTEYARREPIFTGHFISEPFEVVMANSTWISAMPTCRRISVEPIAPDYLPITAKYWTERKNNVTLGPKQFP